MRNQITTLAQVSALAMFAGFAATVIAPAPAAAQISIGINVNIAPPVLPVYVQPPLPSPGYIWAPGYWAWDRVIGDYYWVPGAWVSPPRVGLLWTPGYWGWSNGVYLFHGGYWGPTVGFYGGVNYGFGYTSAGFFGGEWRGGRYFYNSSVNNVTNVNVTNVYNKTVVVNNNAPRTSFNGGPNGTAVKPTPAQLAAAKAPHVAPTAAQVQHVNAAKADPAARFSTNKGKPEHAVAEKPLPGGGEKGQGGAPTGAEEKGGGPQTEKKGPQESKPLVEHPERPAGERRDQVERPQPEHARPQVERRAPPPPRPAPPPRRAPPPRPAPHPGPGCRGPQCH
jgi:WXXGXW repeat (2 copies)